MFLPLYLSDSQLLPGHPGQRIYTSENGCTCPAPLHSIGELQGFHLRIFTFIVKITKPVMFFHFCTPRNGTIFIQILMERTAS